MLPGSTRSSNVPTLTIFEVSAFNLRFILVSLSNALNISMKMKSDPIKFCGDSVRKQVSQLVSASFTVTDFSRLKGPQGKTHGNSCGGTIIRFALSVFGVEMRQI